MVEVKVVTIHDRIPKLKEQRRQRANRRLIFFLSFFFLLILFVIYFQSPLSQIKNIEVNGNYHIDDKQIIKRSSIQEGTSIWNLDTTMIEERISTIDEVNRVEVQRKLPTTIIIEVEEHPRVAYLFNDGKYYPILATGRFLPELPLHQFPSDAPILKNWEQGDVVEELATELMKLPESLKNRISEIYHTPTESDEMRVTLFMNDGYEVHSTIRNFSERLAPYPSIVRELDPTVKGIVHMRMNPYFEQYEIEEDEEIEGER
ncbi:cell division protein FtsQ/DivIB [Bacillus sp. FJAT-45350]|uniref:cell division protein FtsQ/DivIB n=1 Tax=Bacillus sp. FJAT-45350 TaxID=2011014 RepID=UPI000BB6D354|nr:FtsQ-type POTRA domain-containing protein [Bacillus sp. FJAT-45350]